MAEYKMAFGQNFDELVRDLQESKDNSATTKADVIRRAVALYHYLHQEVATNPGSRVAVIGAADDVLVVIDPLP